MCYYYLYIFIKLFIHDKVSFKQTHNHETGSETNPPFRSCVFPLKVSNVDDVASHIRSDSASSTNQLRGDRPLKAKFG